MAKLACSGRGACSTLISRRQSFRDDFAGEGGTKLSGGDDRFASMFSGSRWPKSSLVILFSKQVMSESASVDTLAKCERAESGPPADSLTRDMANPAMYAPAAFPRPKKTAETLTPTVVEEVPATKDDFATDDIQPDRADVSVLRDEESSRRGRASQALAEMKNAAQQRGLLKSSGDLDDPSASELADTGECSTKPERSSCENSPAAAIANGKIPTRREEPAKSEALQSAVDEETGGDTAKPHPKQVDDTSRRERLEVLADWLTNSIGMNEVFLIDSCGYSLLPEKIEKTNGGGAEIPEQAGAAGTLHDLGLRLGGVLELAGRRLVGESSCNGTERGDAGRVARLTIDNGRCLAVAKIAMTQDTERPLLGWVEPLRSPLADSWVETACDYTAKVLAHDFMS